ncbi:MAG TPA: DMT family transporter [Blastocatellia bacterium]|nr:DMT family transporter [Blastocatellia bacterium]
MSQNTEVKSTPVPGKRAFHGEPAPAAVYLSMTFAVIAVAFSSIFITKLEHAGVRPVIVALYRMALATAMLLPASIKFRRSEIASLAKRDLFLLGLSGFFLALHFLSWITSLQYIPIAASVMLVASHPLFVVIAAHFLLSESPTRRNMAGIAIGLIGTVLICSDGLRGLGNALYGDGLALLGAISMVGYFLIGRRTRMRISLLGYATPVYASCSVFLLAWAVCFRENLTGYTKGDWMYFTALAIVPTILGHTVLNWAIKHVRASAVSISLLGEPVVAAILALLFFAQQPSGSTIGGGALVLLGIYFATSGSTNLPARPGPTKPCESLISASDGLT